jgi:MoaA/NifB/PqqE/SkfB family radical SAM enzyme
MNGRISNLPVLVINPHGTCNCRCVMCDIWKRTTPQQIGPNLFDAQLADIQTLGVEWVVFSGGEPLLHADIFRKASELRRRGIRVTLLSSGLLLSRHAGQIVRHFDDLIVSLDGPRAIHNRIRGISRAFELMAAGVARIHSERPEFPVNARCTVQRANCAHLMDTVAASRSMGLFSVSFLAADMHSTAFNRQALPVIDGLNIVAPGREDLAELNAQIKALIEAGFAGGYVRESPEKLQKIFRHFECALNGESPVAPHCNAPWTSAVIEADGAVRPCFFHPPVGRIGEGASLAAVLNGPEGVTFRGSLDVETNPICRKCVCSLHWAKSADVSHGSARV